MNAAEPPPGTEKEHRSHHNREVIYATCTERGGGRFTNLVVTKRDGAIELNPHVPRQCMPILAEDADQSLTLGEALAKLFLDNADRGGERRERRAPAR